MRSVLGGNRFLGGGIAGRRGLDALSLNSRTQRLLERIALGQTLFTEGSNQFWIWRIERTTQAQAHSTALRIDADDPEQEWLTLVDHLLRMGDALVGQLGDVDQTFDPILDPGKGAEIGELGHSATH